MCFMYKSLFLKRLNCNGYTFCKKRMIYARTQFAISIIR